MELKTVSGKRVHNFGAGSASLPLEVLKIAQNEFLNYQESGMSVLEMTHLDQENGQHPGVPFNKLQEMMLETEKKIRDVLKVPENFRILFQHGGATGQFSAIPMNFCQNVTDKADYVNLGIWSQKAANEAKKYCDVHQPIEMRNELKPVSEWNIRKDAKYVHFTMNETIQGFEFLCDPEWNDELPPLIADCTSTILSRPINFKHYGMIYASGGKNIPTGMCLVIIREDMLKLTPNPFTPYIMDYRQNSGAQFPKQSIFESRPNSPLIFPVYMLGLVCDYIKRQYGSLETLQKNVIQRSNKIYEIIDNSEGFYNCKIQKGSRSAMSAVIKIGKIGDPIATELEKQFYAEAQQQNMINLFGLDFKEPETQTGGLIVRGIRITMYIGVSNEAIQSIGEFLVKFKEQNFQKLQN